MLNYTLCIFFLNVVLKLFSELPGQHVILLNLFSLFSFLVCKTSALAFKKTHTFYTITIKPARFPEILGHMLNK